MSLSHRVLICKVHHPSFLDNFEFSTLLGLKHIPCTLDNTIKGTILTCLTLWTSLWRGIPLWVGRASIWSPKFLGVTIGVSSSTSGECRVSSSLSSPFLSSYSADPSDTDSLRPSCSSTSPVKNICEEKTNQCPLYFYWPVQSRGTSGAHFLWALYPQSLHWTPCLCSPTRSWK